MISPPVRWPAAGLPIDGAGQPSTIMTTEIDLPCADCGTDLHERTLPAHTLLHPIEGRQYLTVADCPGCDARYYPHDTVSVLAEVLGLHRTEGGS